jgi:fatty-acyl-CoA synthase
MNVKNVVIMYGLTEASPGVSSTRIGDSLREKCDTVGKVWPGQDILLVDKYQTPDGITAGEICVRGYNVMKGYYKNYDATAKTIDDDAWLHTGDIASVGIDGEIVLLGRKKDIIIHKGENISPIEIEEFLKNYSFISEAYVVGAKDCKCGEVIYAFVKPQTISVIDEHALIADMHGKIASIKIPSRICCVEDFPRTNTGKVLKRELRVQAQEIHDKLKGDAIK